MRRSRPTSAPRVQRALATLALAASSIVLAAASCARSLEDLAPFPCPADGVCPDGLSCVTTARGSPDPGAAGVGGASGGAERLCMPACADEGHVDCGDGCLDPTSDASHCGGCGNDCPGGACCGGSCADLQTSPAHCGDCATVCKPGAECRGGACACPVGAVDCGAQCVDTTRDPAHCGSCAESCDANSFCENGTCLTCGAGEKPCGSTCVEENDPKHCGGCGIVCPDGVCTDGRCEYPQCNGGPFQCAPGEHAHCGAVVGASCCPPNLPGFCDYPAAPCWTGADVDCSTITYCPETGAYHACAAGEAIECSPAPPQCVKTGPL